MLISLVIILFVTLGGLALTYLVEREEPLMWRVAAGNVVGCALFGSVAFLARVQAARGIALLPGTWVSTGSITGVHPVSPGQSVRATFDRVHEVACRTTLFVPAPEGSRESVL